MEQQQNSKAISDFGLENLSLTGISKGLPSHMTHCLEISRAAEALTKKELNGAVVPDTHRKNPFECEYLRSYLLEGKKSYGGEQSEIPIILRNIRDQLGSKANAALKLLEGDLREICEALSRISDVTPQFKLTAHPQLGESWHTDRGLSLAFVTYHGPGTQFVDNSDALPSSNGRYSVRGTAQIHQAATNEILFMRGDLYGQQTSQGLCHRAPPGGNRGERIIMYAFVPTDKARLFGEQCKTLSR